MRSRSWHKQTHQYLERISQLRVRIVMYIALVQIFELDGLVLAPMGSHVKPYLHFIKICIVDHISRLELPT